MAAMEKTRGFSIFELLMVLAVIAVVSAIVAPNVIKWRNNAKMRDAVDNLMADLEMAKISAVKENNFVAVLFNPTGYRVFVDKTNFWVRDTDERLLRDRKLPGGITFDFGNPNWGFSNNRTRFNSRGRADTNNGTAVIVNSDGQQRDVIVSSLGRIRFEKID
jgi:prepilin-type N-terminal cleavage/methylation domain-containing protein